MVDDLTPEERRNGWDAKTLAAYEMSRLITKPVGGFQVTVVESPRPKPLPEMQGCTSFKAHRYRWAR
jgi:hypothetical protein